MSRLPLSVALRIAPAEARNRSTARFLRATRRERFAFDGQSYPYLFHHYNATWTNERAVEVPLALRALQRHPAGRVLEVGNVLNNYTRNPRAGALHEVIDKYEQAPGVTNVDVVDHAPEAPYDLVLSVSTIEHVGWDEEPREPHKAAAAIERLHGWLAPGGELLVTMPLGHNPPLDSRLLDGPPMFDRLGFLRRQTPSNRWGQADGEEVRGAEYGSPFPFANVIAVGRSSR